MDDTSNNQSPQDPTQPETTNPASVTPVSAPTIDPSQAQPANLDQIPAPQASPASPLPETSPEPSVATSEQPIQTEQPQQPTAQSHKILIVEDDPIIQRMYTTKLTFSGFEVKQAGNGQEAIDSLASSKPDIILLDLMLPKVDGFTFLQKSAEQIKGIPVIILSNLSQDTDKERAKSLGAVDFMVKADITPQDVVNKIQEHLST